MITGPRDVGRFTRLFFLIWAIWTLVVVSAMVGIGYVIVHFVAKYW